jgi:hypothetical protein
VTLETSPRIGGAWSAVRSTYGIESQATLRIPAIDHTAFFRARAVNPSEADGPWTLQESDLLDLENLNMLLQAPPDGDLVSGFLYEQLPAPTQSLVLSYGGPQDAPALRTALTSGFNALITSGASLYSPERFDPVPLSPSTQELIRSNPVGPDLERLNRQLLEDAYPGLLLQRLATGFTNFVHSFGTLTTLAGSGIITCVSCDSWDPAAEGGPATEAPLSSPHIAMADRAGNVYIADKRANAIRKVSPDGTITTVAGTGVGEKGDTNAAPAVSLPLNNPNGLWVRADGSYYILDRDNGFIRKVDRDGIMTVVVDNGSPIAGGRGLWVSEDESLIYFAAGSAVMQWDSVNGLSTFATGFSALGNFAMDPQGRLVVTDANRNQVVRFEPDGTQTVIAGTPTGTGGGEGYLATQTGFTQVRGICFLPDGSYLLCTDAGSQVWYVDTDAHAHLLLDGDVNNAHAGDDAWFYDQPSLHKTSNVRAVTLDYDGNLLITESNWGYVRRIQFLPPTVP